MEYYLIIMIIKSIIYASFLATVIFLSNLGFANAQDISASAFKQYTNPHDICNFYRGQGIKVVRESDTECLTSLGEGQNTVYTQYYYSNNNWCYRLTQRGQTQHSNCIPIPKDNTLGSVSKSANNSIDSFLNNFHIDSDNKPYVFAGGVILILVIVLSVISSVYRSNYKTSNDDTDTEQEKSFNPKVKRSGKGGYGWEEMETSTTEEINAKPPNNLGEGQSQGGKGLHDEPLVKSTADELEKLVKLKNKGVLTDKEFNLAKKKLLG